MVKEKNTIMRKELGYKNKINIEFSVQWDVENIS